MASWSCLPPEIKQHVVKRLDFMSRHSLRHTSRLDRQIVDSTKCQVPRVRFGYKEGRGLIVVYTGIDQFLRIEMEEKEDGILVRKFENTYDPAQGTHPCLMKADPKKVNLPAFMSKIFLFLLNRAGIRIRVLEFEIPKISGSDEDHMAVRKSVYITMASINQRVDRVVFCGILDTKVACEVLRGRGERSGATGYLKLFGQAGELVPMVATDYSTEEHENGTVNAVYSTEKIGFNDEQDEEKNRKLLARDMKAKKDCLMVTLRNSNYRNKPKNVRSQTGNLVQWTKITQCGFSIRTVRKSHEEEFKEELESTECGIGDLCKRCSDPFDYWYTQNLPRRLYFEPFWDSVLYQSIHLGVEYQRDIRNLKLKLEKYERKKQRIQKIVEEKKGKNQVAFSWGFRKEDAVLEKVALRSVLFSFHKKDHNIGEEMHIIFKTTVKPPKMGENSEVPFDIQENEDIIPMEIIDDSSTQETPKVEQQTTVIFLKYLTLFFFIPILISIGFYFFFY